MPNFRKDLHSHFHKHREEAGTYEAVYCLLIAHLDDEFVADDIVQQHIKDWEKRDSSYLIDTCADIAAGYKQAEAEITWLKQLTNQL